MLKLLFFSCGTLCTLFNLFFGQLNAIENAPTRSAEKKKPFVLINTPSYNPGMFSVFTSVIGALHKYDMGEYAGLKISLNNGFYFDPQIGPNWWEYFFEPVQLGSRKSFKYEKIDDRMMSQFARLTVYKLSRERGHQLITKYIRIKPVIQKKVDKFVKNGFSGHYVIGVHYRGTDKIGQGGGIPYITVFAAIQKAIDEVPLLFQNKYKIFVATDEQDFIDAIQKQFSCQMMFIDSIRSTNHKPVHIDYYTSNYQKGEDALLDCLLLANCNILLRMDSNLCFCAGLFNPDIPIVFMK